MMQAKSPPFLRVDLNAFFINVPVVKLSGTPI
jgi:hypothetical protein